MLRGIADTHTLIWYLFGDHRLSATAKTFLETTAAEGNQVGFSAITLAEIVYLAEKGRIPGETFSRLLASLTMPDSVLVEIPFDRRIAEALFRVDRLKVPDLPDRIIAATALYLNVQLISRDAKIQVSGVATLW